MFEWMLPFAARPPLFAEMHVAPVFEQFAVGDQRGQQRPRDDRCGAYVEQILQCGARRRDLRASKDHGGELLPRDSVLRPAMCRAEPPVSRRLDHRRLHERLYRRSRARKHPRRAGAAVAAPDALEERGKIGGRPIQDDEVNIADVDADLQCGCRHDDEARSLFRFSLRPLTHAPVEAAVVRPYGITARSERSAQCRCHCVHPLPRVAEEEGLLLVPPPREIWEEGIFHIGARRCRRHGLDLAPTGDRDDRAARQERRPHRLRVRYGRAQRHDLRRASPGLREQPPQPFEQPAHLLAARGPVQEVDLVEHDSDDVIERVPTLRPAVAAEDAVERFRRRQENMRKCRQFGAVIPHAPLDAQMQGIERTKQPRMQIVEERARRREIENCPRRPPPDETLHELRARHLGLAGRRCLAHKDAPPFQHCGDRGALHRHQSPESRQECGPCVRKVVLNGAVRPKCFIGPQRPYRLHRYASGGP